MGGGEAAAANRSRCRNGLWRRERGGLTQRRGVADRLPGGGRFLTIGETLRRLTGKCLLRARRAACEADYFECGGAAGYRRSSSPSSSGSGSSSGTSGHRGVSSP